MKVVNSSLSAYDEKRKLVHVIVETARGSSNKYKYDEVLGLFRLHKRLPRGAFFPFDFGFVPGTLGEDGDPIDVLVLTDEGTFPGCLVTTRLLGVLLANQKEKGKSVRNDRLIGLAETEKIRPKERTLDDLAEGVLDQIEHFFVSYNRMEGREFEILGRKGPAAARRLIDQAMRSARKPVGSAADGGRHAREGRSSASPRLSRK